MENYLFSFDIFLSAFVDFAIFKKQVTKGQLWPKYSNYSRLRMENSLTSLRLVSGFKVRGLFGI